MKNRACLKSRRGLLGPLAFALALLLAAARGGARLPAETIVQWDLDGDLGAGLEAGAAAPAGAPSVAFEDALVGGRAAQVAAFSRGTYFRARPGFAPNGGGKFVNQYTLIVDVMFPDRSPSGGWAALLQTNDTNSNDADWFVSPTGALGITGSYHGSVPEAEWHRLALAVDLAEGTYTSYVDGVKVQELKAQALDGRFSLFSTSDGNREGFLLFADENGDNAEGYVDAVQVRDAALCDGDIAAIGGIAAPLAPTAFPPRICNPQPPPELHLKEGPYLQWATKSEITVMWETSVAADATLFYRRSGGAWTEASGAAARKIHEVRVGGFSPQETVEYYVRSRLEGQEVLSSVSAFQTNPDQDIDFNFVIWGDSHVNPPVFSALVSSMVTLSPEIGMCCGDVVNTGSIYSEWGEGLLTPLEPLGRSVPFYIAIGNHEGNSHWFYDYFAQPGNEHWFSIDYAGCHFVILDTNFPFGPGTQQYEWVKGDLFSDAARNAKWLFAFHHHPPYSELIEETIYAQVRMHLVPLFESAGVDIDFTGHIHDYERGLYVPPDTGRRIAYIQTSGAGGRLWDDEYDGDWEQIEKVIQYVYHYCEVKVEGDALSFRAIDLRGNVIDSLSLTRMPRNGEPPPPPPPPPPSEGKAITQWDFDVGGLAPTFGPGSLEFMDRDAGVTASRTGFGTTASFGIPGIGGRTAGVMRFPKATSPTIGFRVAPEAPANGGGSLVNEYTMAFDILVPSASFSSDAWLAFFQTDAENASDGEFFARFDTGGIGISGQYAGRILPNTWHRVAAAFRNEGGGMVLHKHIDGVEVGAQALDAPDGRWAIHPAGGDTPWFLLFTDNDAESTSAYVSSLLFIDRALSAGEVAALGGPDAGGIAGGPCRLGGCGGSFRRGDANGDGSVDIADVVFTLFFLFGGGRSPACEKSMDANDDGALQVSDAIYSLEFLFRGGPPIQAPSPACGEDPTEDDLACAPAAPCL